MLTNTMQYERGEKRINFACTEQFTGQKDEEGKNDKKNMLII